ncbi:MAG: extracellular solute-binding protein [Acetatifactor sp.]|nr:extracellular solute-binding protein [Acetatifactor sp.]
MKLKTNSKLIAVLAAAAVIIIILVVIGVRSGARGEANAVPKQVTASYEESYRDYLEANGYDGKLSGSEVTVDLEKFTLSADMVANIGEQGILTEDNGTITWEFQVAESGFYNVELGYIALPGTTSDIQRKVYIDGEIPYEALSQIVIKRWWQDREIREKNKNEIRPEADEVYDETRWFLEDYQRRNNGALIVYLEKGKHTIGFEVIKEPLEFTSITFKAAEQPSAYAEVIDALKGQYPVYGGKNFIYQAERQVDGTVGIIKSSSSINIQKNYSDSELQPFHPYYIVYNTIGAENWAQPGDSITWQIEVLVEGLYELSFKGRQNLNRGVTSYRRLYVNGQVPYAEMQAIGFDYQNGMNNYTVADAEGNPYLFHLQEGINTITLENVMGPMGSIITQVEESMTVLNRAYLDVIQLTGQVPNRFIDYEIVKKLPDFADTMREQSDLLYSIIDEIVAITGEKGENTAMLEKMAMEASWLADDPESVIMELGQFKNNVSALGTWLVNVASMPLELDYLVLSAENAELPKAQDSFFAGLGNGTVRFFSTFFIKNSQITEGDSGNGARSIKVWLASYGREQAQMIQNMIEEEFTPDKDISVNLQLIPVDVVLRAALAGNGPDVVIGLGQGTLQDFAMRNAVQELSGLEGYDEATERFYESSLQASAFRGGYYGIPEQTTFMMLFTRDDILADLELEVPDTWQELREIIPELQKNNYNIYIPNVQQTEATTNSSSIAYNMNLYLGMVMQNGGNPYLGEGDDYGIESGLASDAAMIAFKDYTDFFTGYGLDVQVDFSNRFRTGEIPVGITGYTTFNQLEIFAPEIKGLWSFHPIPGVLQEDGTIDRSFAVDTTQSVIMAKCRDLDSSWEFLKWWTSTDTQLQFANSLEALMGTSARYAAADPEVLKQLPWSNAELNSLLSQFEQTVGIEAVPGNYMTTRMVQYSFNDVVSDHANPRETLYLNIKDIDQELTRKREELHLSVKEQGGGEHE